MGLFGPSAEQQCLERHIKNLYAEIVKLRKELSDVELKTYSIKSHDCAAEISVGYVTKELYALYDYLGVEPKINSGITFVKKTK